MPRQSRAQLHYRTFTVLRRGRSVYISSCQLHGGTKLLAAFSALRVYALTDCNRFITAIVGILSLVPLGTNLVRLEGAASLMKRTENFSYDGYAV